MRTKNGFLALSKIRTDGGTQSRAELSDAVIDDYAQALDALPPVTVFYDGKVYWLADGFHRFRAFERAGDEEINAVIHQGTQRDAILFSVGANAQHGLRRTNEDKRRAVLKLLNDAEWREWSDHQIAYRCAVSHTFVGSLRPAVTGNVSSERAYKTKQGTTAKMKTAGINADRRQREPELVRDRPHQQIAAPVHRIEPSELDANAALDAAEEAVERRRDFLASWERLAPADREWAYQTVLHWKNSLPAHDSDTGEIVDEAPPVNSAIFRSRRANIRAADELTPSSQPLPEPVAETPIEQRRGPDIGETPAPALSGPTSLTTVPDPWADLEIPASLDRRGRG